MTCSLVRAPSFVSLLTPSTIIAHFGVVILAALRVVQNEDLAARPQSSLHHVRPMMTIGTSHVALSGFVLLVAWGLAVRLNPDLKYIPYAFSLGILAALTGACVSILSISKGCTAPFGPRKAVLKFAVPAYWVTERRALDRRTLSKHSSSGPIRLRSVASSVADAFHSVLDLILQNFVSSWYRSISTNSAFVVAINDNVVFALDRLGERARQEDVAALLVSKVVPILSTHLAQFDAAERLVKSKILHQDIMNTEEFDLAVAARYNNGKLHPAASLTYSSTKIPQQEHLRKILLRLLPTICAESMVQSRVVFVLVKEMVACAILSPVLQTLSDPDTWNQVISNYGAATLQDRKTVKRMRAALDEHASALARSEPYDLPPLKPRDTERAFERFVRVIRKTNTLSDARRFRNQVASQLAKERLENTHDPIYIRRLEMGKRVLDQKVAKLSQINTPTSRYMETKIATNASMLATTPSMPSLVDIMHTTSGLSYFMEHMDRQGKTTLVQFWTVVDGFRNPLEDDFGDDQAMALVTWSQTDRLDIAQIMENYMNKPELNIPKEFLESVQSFLMAGRKATPQQYRSARMAILSAQSAVLEEIEAKYLPTFRKTDLYYKFLASEEGQSLFRNRAKIETPSIQALKAIGARATTRTPATSRTRSQPPAIIANGLQRAAASSSDLKGSALLRHIERTTEDRRSLDLERKPLFHDDDGNDPLSLSVQSLDDESVNNDEQNNAEILENMEAVMSDIITETPYTIVSELEPESLFSSPTDYTRPATLSDPGHLFSGSSRDALQRAGVAAKPNLASLGLVNNVGRIGVFQDDDLFGDEEHLTEDEDVDRDDRVGKDDIEAEVVAAAPGDLGLREAITALSNDIERLVSQESVVDALTRKAELTNNTAELRILGKSKSSLQREIRRKELQRQQYIVQESGNSLYGRATIRIKSVMVGREDDGSEFAVYVIEVQRQAGGPMPPASWVIAHRYSEFHDLHQKLRRRYPSTRGLEFPRRRMVMKLQRQFLHNRRISLETYLQQLLRMPDVCASRELRSFLSQQAINSSSDSNHKDPNATDAQDIISRIYNSVTDGMDEFLGNIAVIDQLSVAGQNLISAAQNQLSANSPAAGGPSPGTNPRTNNAPDGSSTQAQANSIAEAEAELRAFEDQQAEPFVKPICDLFLEAFELNRSSNWLRGRALVVVLQQLLGGTIERKTRETVKSLLSDDALIRYLTTAKTTLFPNDGNTTTTTNNTNTTDNTTTTFTSSPRTKSQRDSSKAEAGIVLATLLPDLAGNVVGRTNALAASKRLLAVINNRRLNEHLLYTILDVFVGVLVDGKAGRAGNRG